MTISCSPQDNNDGITNMFGPLLAMHSGRNHTVRLQNELTAPGNDYLVCFQANTPLTSSCIAGH